VSKKGC